LPTYAFKPVKKIPQPETTATATETPAAEPVVDVTTTEEGDKAKVIKNPVWAETDEPFEFTEETREKINQTLKRYVGSHNFHNFTNSLAPKDKKCQRIVNSFEVSTKYYMIPVSYLSCSHAFVIT
jgi:tRNA pseudouridine38-40 synthase